MVDFNSFRTNFLLYSNVWKHSSLARAYSRLFMRTIVERMWVSFSKNGRKYIYILYIIVHICHFSILFWSFLKKSHPVLHVLEYAVLETKYKLKVNNRNFINMWNMLKANHKTPEECQWRRFGFFIINFEHNYFSFLCCFYYWLWTDFLCWEYSAATPEEYSEALKERWTFVRNVLSLVC